MISKKGSYPFGGAEKFLLDAASQYASEGYEVVFVGFEPPQDEIEFAYPCTFVEPSVEALRPVLLDLDPAFVHAVSGALELTCEALRGFEIPIVKGIHFWSEIIEPAFLAQRRGFFAETVTQIDKSFELLLYSPGPVYVNSLYLRSVFEGHFGFSPPVIPSLSPEDATQPGTATADLPESWRDYVLLLNGRADKGAYFVLDLAKDIPETDFVVVCSQGNRAMMTAEVQTRQLENVIVLDRRDDVDGLIDRAAVVLCPSFRFVETFGRIPFEALRRNKPVLMARQGNFPYLAPHSEYVLPEDQRLWASKIRQIVTDPPTVRLEEILDPSVRPAAFQDGIARIEGQVRLSAAVCVGSGIGNCIHATPAIRFISETLGVPVDVVVKGDFAANQEVFAQSPWVGTTFNLGAGVLAKPYDLVMALQCFGEGPTTFNAQNVFFSRDWEGFDPTVSEHEAVFNMRFAAHVLGTDPPDAEATAARYFFADLERQRPASRPVIGLHAGSKGGRWEAKRWGHFAPLATALAAAGFDVRSFGLAEELVPGTEDFTGLSLRDSAAAMLECGVIVSNDSGFMNLAAALDIPLVALFGPTTVESRGPINRQASILRADLACMPCELMGEKYTTQCAVSGAECMAALSVEAVLNAVTERMRLSLPEGVAAV